MKTLHKSQSQVGQENFVLFVLAFKTSGTFLEVGASDGFTINNTLVLENTYGWKGVAVELDPILSGMYNESRINPCLTADATTLDYESVLNSYAFPDCLEYLQVDIDPAFQSLVALKIILNGNRRFKIITFEHDLYLSPSNMEIKIEAHELLTRAGYSRVRNNVRYDGSPFEDWYVDFLKVSRVRVSIYRLLVYLHFINIFVEFKTLRLGIFRKLSLKRVTLS